MSDLQACKQSVCTCLKKLLSTFSETVPLKTPCAVRVLQFPEALCAERAVWSLPQPASPVFPLGGEAVQALAESRQAVVVISPVGVRAM